MIVSQVHSDAQEQRFMRIRDAVGPCVQYALSHFDQEDASASANAFIGDLDLLTNADVLLSSKDSLFSNLVVTLASPSQVKIMPWGQNCEDANSRAREEGLLPDSTVVSDYEGNFHPKGFKDVWDARWKAKKASTAMCREALIHTAAEALTPGWDEDFR
jgi:hypothetical protein